MRTLALLVLVAHARLIGEATVPPVVSAQDESDVQAAVLDSFFVRPGIERLVVVDSTVEGADHFVDQDYASALLSLGGPPKDLREDFEKKRRVRIRVQGLRTRVPVVLFTQQDRLALRGVKNPTEYWQRFNARFPASSGRLAISRVGFSRDGQHALMLVDYGCGGLCGGTVYYLAVREDQRWRIVRTAQPRIS